MDWQKDEADDTYTAIEGEGRARARPNTVTSDLVEWFAEVVLGKQVALRTPFPSPEAAMAWAEAKLAAMLGVQLP